MGKVKQSDKIVLHVRVYCAKHWMCWRLHQKGKETSKLLSRKTMGTYLLPDEENCLHNFAVASHAEKKPAPFSVLEWSGSFVRDSHLEWSNQTGGGCQQSEIFKASKRRVTNFAIWQKMQPVLELRKQESINTACLAAEMIALRTRLS